MQQRRELNPLRSGRPMRRRQPERGNSRVSRGWSSRQRPAQRARSEEPAIQSRAQGSARTRRQARYYASVHAVKDASCAER